MHVSSTSKGKDEDINSYQDNCIHLSDQQSNQWVSWKIISDKAIQPTEYIVRSAPANANSASLLQSWEVVGTTIEGKKEVLSKVNNSPLSPGEIRTYSLNTDKKYTSFRLTQTDLNADGSNYLLLDVFDFSGYVFDYEDD